jgi:HD-GYP domain-containing protein (c-di-GMP phosphodiesterase class II)
LPLNQSALRFPFLPGVQLEGQLGLLIQGRISRFQNRRPSIREATTKANYEGWPFQSAKTGKKKCTECPFVEHRRKQVTMRFHTRAFLICFVPFAVLLAASFWMAQKLVQSTVRADLRETLRENQLAMAHAQSKADFQNSRFLKIAGEDGALKAGMQLFRSGSDSEDARRRMEDQLGEFGEHMGFDFLFVSSRDGEPLAGVVRQGKETRGGKSQLVPLDTALIEHSDKGLLVIGSRIFQFASVPIVEDEKNIGSLSMGEYFDFPGTATPAVLIHDREVIDFNIPNVSESEVGAAILGCAGRSECDLRLGGVNWISVPMQDLGGGYTLWSLENVGEATGPIRSRLRNLFLTMGFGSVLVALLCSVASSRSIVKPIALVVSHLRNAERTGVLPEFTTGLSSTSEIRELTESYRRAAVSVRNSRENLQRAYVEFVGSLANALDARDRYTSGHSFRVSQTSCATAAAMGLSPEEVERIRIGALLHDIGKIGIADRVLQKAGRLTNKEFAIVKQHPVIGRRILEGVRGLAPFLGAVELHHENWDGSGYPKGLSGEETPLDARIIHVSDAYDAMTTNRSYRPGMTHARAIRELFAYAGTQFDPQIVEVFAKLPRAIVAGRPLLLEDRAEVGEFKEVEAG